MADECLHRVELSKKSISALKPPPILLLHDSIFLVLPLLSTLHQHQHSQASTIYIAAWLTRCRYLLHSATPTPGVPIIRRRAERAFSHLDLVSRLECPKVTSLAFLSQQPCRSLNTAKPTLYTSVRPGNELKRLLPPSRHALFESATLTGTQTLLSVLVRT